MWTTLCLTNTKAVWALAENKCNEHFINHLQQIITIIIIIIPIKDL